MEEEEKERVVCWRACVLFKDRVTILLFALQAIGVLLFFFVLFCFFFFRTKKQVTRELNATTLCLSFVARAAGCHGLCNAKDSSFHYKLLCLTCLICVMDRISSEQMAVFVYLSYQVYMHHTLYTW